MTAKLIKYVIGVHGSNHVNTPGQRCQVMPPFLLYAILAQLWRRKAPSLIRQAATDVSVSILPGALRCQVMPPCLLYAILVQLWRRKAPG